MRRQVVAGNWKMHGSCQFVDSFASEFLYSLPDYAPAEVLVFPPFGYLQCAAAAFSGRIALGVQNLHPAESGAFTGEHAAEMAWDLGARWALVGHSERRALFGETFADTAAKVGAAVRAGLHPLLCVGETLDERRAGRAEAVVLAQLDEVITAQGSGWLPGGMIAYEPVWAIGTGETATPDQAQAMHAVVRAELARHNPDAAAQTRILYGGSVSPDTAADLFAQPDIDGGLVGGASLVAEKFLAIAGAVE